MRPHNSVNTLIEDLLGDPLADLSAIGWNPHKRGHCRRQAAGAQYLPTIQHELQTIPQRADIVGPMLHLEDDTVVGCGVNRLSCCDLGRRKCYESRLALLQGSDHTVQSRN